MGNIEWSMLNVELWEWGSNRTNTETVIVHDDGDNAADMVFMRRLR